MFVCNSISCWIAGSDDVIREAESGFALRLGETSADGRLTILPIVCLGACDRAPAVMIDDDVYQAGPGTMSDILQRYT